MQSKDGSFKGNPFYFGRKSGGIVDVIEKMNKQNPKPVIKTVMDDKEEYQKVFQKALKKFGVKGIGDFKDEQKKKDFFNYIDKNYTADNEAMDMKAKAQNKKLKDAEGEEKGKKMGNVVVHGETAKPFFHPSKMKEALAKVWEKSINEATFTYDFFDANKPMSQIQADARKYRVKIKVNKGKGDMGADEAIITGNERDIIKYAQAQLDATNKVRNLRDLGKELNAEEKGVKEGGPGSGPKPLPPGAGTRGGSAPDGGQTDDEHDEYEDQIASQKKLMAMMKKKKNEKKEVEVDEKLDDKDKEDVMKTADMLAKASKAHAAQSKDLKKQIKD
jgi:hypothetical protein